MIAIQNKWRGWRGRVRGGLLLLSLALFARSARGGDAAWLTETENEWLRAHPVIRVAPDPSFPPIEYLDEKGVFRGIIADYLSLVEEKLPVHFQIVRCRDWHEVLRNVRERRVDLLSAAAQTPDRRRYVNFARPHLVLPGVIITRKGAKKHLTAPDLLTRKTVVVKSYLWEEYLKKDYPEIKLDLVADISSGLKAVSLGRADALVATLPVAIYYIEKEGITNLQVAGETGYDTRLSFAARSDWPELTGILNKTMRQIPPARKEAILSRWIHLQPESIFARKEFWLIILIGMGSLALLAGGVFVWNRSLQHQVKQRTRALEEELEKRHRMEEELLRMRKLESLGVLAGGIAHDFNNFLMAIIGNLSLAKQKAGPDSPLFIFLNEAEKASQRARSLTRQLLTFARGGMPVKKTAPLDRLLKESAGFVLHGSNVRAEYTLAPDLFPVEMDQGQIGQVINNLVINARQALPRGGVIYIKAENIRLKEDEIHSLSAGRYVKVTVRDNGIGIAPEHLSQIFDPYFTTKQEGSGLGLAGVYSIIKNHGGMITVESRLGKGSTFYFYLPASPPGRKVELPREDQLPRGEGRILLMDDDRQIREVTQRMLSALGYKVEVAADGTAALEIFRAAIQGGNPFAAVILDLTVPGGRGGKEIIAELKELDPGIKALVSSGYSNDPVMADFRSYGFAGVIAKPYRLRELAETLARLFREPPE